MARRIRVPGLIDLVRVADPREIRSLDDEPRLDRCFKPRGPVVNRLIARRIRRWFQVDGRPLPSLLPRGDQFRADRQRGLAAKLDPAADHSLWSDAQLERLAAFVRGETSRDEAGITVQEVVGRRFNGAFGADPASWQAAELIDRFRDGFSLSHLIWQLTGRIRRARELLLKRAGNDPLAMHGIAIGVHGIVNALDRMRALRAEGAQAWLTEDAVLSRCLVPPKRVPRTVEAAFASPALARGVRPGTLIMFELAAAWRHAPDPEMIFMHGHWNACPAGAFVTGLLRAVWSKAGNRP